MGRGSRVRIPMATRNRNKIDEANYVLRDFGIELYPVNVEKLEIQSEDLEEIARFAALQAYQALGKPVVVEDSGLFIEALGGFPGPYSSYVYKTIGLKGVLKLMEGEENRKAYFEAVVAIALSEQDVKTFVGRVEGRIAGEARGSHGFGFDPIFIPMGFDKTFAELGIEVKCSLSHRAKAFRAFGEWLRTNIDILSLWETP